MNCEIMKYLSHSEVKFFKIYVNKKYFSLNFYVNKITEYKMQFLCIIATQPNSNSCDYIPMFLALNHYYTTPADATYCT